MLPAELADSYKSLQLFFCFPFFSVLVKQVKVIECVEFNEHAPQHLHEVQGPAGLRLEL